MSNSVEPDINKIAANVIIAATDRTISKVASPARDVFRRTLHSITDAYGPFLETTYRRVKMIRTFLKPSDSIDLLANYVEVSISCNDDRYDVPHLLGEMAGGGRIVVSGLAGRGKSVLMRYLALSLYHAPKGIIPLFIELRSLNDLTNKDIIPYIHAQYKGSSNIKFEDFEKVLSKGYFCLIMDGFDEVEPDARKQVEADILEISRKYDYLSIVISGRPDRDRFNSWDEFKVYNVNPMTYDKVQELIKKSDYDPDVKKTFLKRMTRDFFIQNESFLSTPLLAIMLMLTFEEYTEIPSSLHEFYRNAFDTLLRRHDSLKKQFLRKNHSSCITEEFKGLFGAFCLLTYTKSKFQFSREEVLVYIKTALKQQQIKADAALVLSDLIESICLLQEEGFEISFVHRSFQEYFCAYFVSHSAAGLIEKYLDDAMFRIGDNVLPMLHGMVPERVEAEWASPRVDELIRKYPPDDPESPLHLCLEFWPSVSITITPENATIALGEGPLRRKFEIIKRLYPAQFLAAEEAILVRRDQRSPRRWRDDLVKALNNRASAGDKRFDDYVKQRKEGKSKIFRIHDLEVNYDDIEWLETSGLKEWAGSNLSAIRNIQKDQKQRMRGDDKFFKEVFG